VDRIRVRLASTALCVVAAAAAVLPATGPAVAAGAAAPAAAAPAAPASLGPIRLSATSGTVDANPIVASAATSAPCPAGYGADAQLRVGPAGGPFANLARPLTAGGYDKAVVSARPNRSFTMALGGARPPDGEWWVVVECFSVTQGLHPQRFVTEITVSGPRWRIGRPAGSSQSGSNGQADPAAAAAAVVSGTAAPDGAAVAPSTNAGSAANGTPASSAAAGDPRLAGNSGSGSASFGGVGAMLAVGGVLLIIGVAYLATRRSPAPPSNAKTSKTSAKAKTRV
jgi:hypothetical protein